MIKLEQPSLAINTFDVPGPEYRMEQTVKLDKYASSIVVLSEIQAAATRSGQSYLKNVVINCHGSNGYLYIGEVKSKVPGANGDVREEFDREGIGEENLGLFSLLKGRIGTIWITGCQVSGGSGIVTRSGHTFCPKLAVVAGCNVVAANVYQIINPLRPVPRNCIHEYDGTASIWDATGAKQIYQQGKRA